MGFAEGFRPRPSTEEIEVAVKNRKGGGS